MGDTGLFVCVPWRDGKRRVRKRACAGVFLEQVLSMHGLTALALGVTSWSEGLSQYIFLARWQARHPPVFCWRTYVCVYIYYFIIRHFLGVMENVEVFARVAL